MRRMILLVALGMFLTGSAGATTFVPANDPNIQYFGRWDFSVATAPTHSWPGVYIIAEFQGTSIGVRMADNFCYYNVFIDGTLDTIFHPTSLNVTGYTLATGLTDGDHTIMITKRDETNWTKFSFNGFLLDDGKTLLPPPPKPDRKIEFIGDSFTVAAGDEWTGSDASPSEFYTNNYKGFASIIARNYGADYHITAFSGWGLVQDYLGNAADNLPDIFNRALAYTRLPIWDFSQYVPNLVVICLGLNDLSGWNGYNVAISQQNTDLFKSRYHDFISWIRTLYPGTKILAVAAHPAWTQSTIAQVVAEEVAAGKSDVDYAFFPYYTDAGAYVNNGHPSVATHQKIADTLMAVIDTMHAFQAPIDTTPPVFVNAPSSPFIVPDTAFALTLRTDEYATARFSTHDTSYAAMESSFTTTAGNEHSALLQCRPNQSYTYYARAMDRYGNAMQSSLAIQFTVDTADGPVNWRALNYNDSGWGVGDAPLGSGLPGTDTTVLPQVSAAYFRMKVQVNDVASTGGLRLTFHGNDGAIIYVNGHEMTRPNMPGGTPVPYDTYALTAKALSTSLTMTSSNGQLGYWKNGQNIVAIEVHASNGASRISFDSDLSDSTAQLYYPLQSSWKYYAGGNAPPVIAGSKLDGIVAATGALPAKFSLNQNYPNPFNPSTVISYTLPVTGASQMVQLRVYDILGREVATLVNGAEAAGYHRVTWNASGFATGAYFVRLVMRGQNGRTSIQTMKMMLLK